VLAAGVHAVVSAVGGGVTTDVVVSGAWQREGDVSGQKERGGPTRAHLVGLPLPGSSLWPSSPQIPSMSRQLDSWSPGGMAWMVLVVERGTQDRSDTADGRLGVCRDARRKPKEGGKGFRWRKGRRRDGTWESGSSLNPLSHLPSKQWDASTRRVYIVLDVQNVT
jgi:hypothetical protein